MQRSDTLKVKPSSGKQKQLNHELREPTRSETSSPECLAVDDRRTEKVGEKWEGVGEEGGFYVNFLVGQ